MVFRGMKSFVVLFLILVLSVSFVYSSDSHVIKLSPKPDNSKKGFFGYLFGIFAGSSGPKPSLKLISPSVIPSASEGSGESSGAVSVVSSHWSFCKLFYKS